MADEGIKFSSGMQRNTNPAASARVLIDVDGSSEPQYAELQDLKEGIGIAQLEEKINVSLINTYGFIPNIDTATGTLDLGPDCVLLTGTKTWRLMNVSPKV